MYELKIPDGYKPKMTVRETEKAIKFVKDAFQRNFVKTSVSSAFPRPFSSCRRRA